MLPPVELFRPGRGPDKKEETGIQFVNHGYGFVIQWDAWHDWRPVVRGRHATKMVGEKEQG